MDALVSTDVCSEAALGSGTVTASLLLAAGCLLPMQDTERSAAIGERSLGISYALHDPPAALVGGGRAAMPSISVALLASILHTRWSPERIQDLVGLLGSLGRWPEAAAVFWAALTLLAPAPGEARCSAVGGTAAADAVAAQAVASLTALTDASRTTLLLAVFSLCRNVFMIRSAPCPQLCVVCLMLACAMAAGGSAAAPPHRPIAGVSRVDRPPNESWFLRLHASSCALGSISAGRAGTYVPHAHVCTPSQSMQSASMLYPAFTEPVCRCGD